MQAARTPKKANALETVRHNLTEHSLSHRAVKQAKKTVLRCGMPSIALSQRIDKCINFTDALKIMCCFITLSRALFQVGNLIAGE